MILEIQLELCHIKPTVWRKIHIHKDANLIDLHKIIQLMFDWWDVYPYQFLINTKTKLLSITEKDVTNVVNQNTFHKSKTLASIKLTNLLDEITEPIEYIYGIEPNDYKVLIRIQPVNSEISNEQKYPICVDALNELILMNGHEKEAVRFPFGQQQSLQHTNLVKRLNHKLKHNLFHNSTINRNYYMETVWDDLYSLTKRYYQAKPWKYISNEQIIAIYDEQINEYIFCSILGDHHDLYGLSVYVGFNGLLSLHMSLKQNFSIEQLFQIHSNLLVTFERQTRNEIIPSDKKQPPFTLDNGVVAQFTSYQPGYFPWNVNEQEAIIVTIAIKEVLRLLKRIQSGFSLPNFLEDDSLLLIKRNDDIGETIESTISFKQMMKKILPMQITLSKEEIRRLYEKKANLNMKVEFSLQYVNVPIQRLKGNRPFLPLSSVIANVEDENIIYHNIYDDRLDYKIVQSELLHMIDLLNGIPKEIITDELTYQYVKPLLLHINLPIKVNEHLRVTNHVNTTVSQFLTSTVE